MKGRAGWLIDFAPGTEWPEVDVHAAEERYYVVSGEVIEGEVTFVVGEILKQASWSDTPLHDSRVEAYGCLFSHGRPLGAQERSASWETQIATYYES